MDIKEMGTNTRNWVDSPLDRDYWRALVYASLKHQELLESPFECGIEPPGSISHGVS